MREAVANGPWTSREGPFLVVRTGATCRSLSWAPLGGGFGTATTVVWCQVRGADLAPPVDPVAWLRDRIAGESLGKAIVMMTSRSLDRYVEVQREREGLTARVVATVGLSNGVAAGDPPTFHDPCGTINIHCHVSLPMTDEALVEAIGLVCEARTAALLDEPSPSTLSGRPITGTGTDCAVVTCPLEEPVPGSGRARYAGKHGVVGALIGSTVREAVGRGARQWRADQRDGLIVPLEPTTDGGRA